MTKKEVWEAVLIERIRNGANVQSATLEAVFAVAEWSRLFDSHPIIITDREKCANQPIPTPTVDK